jgi:hypothetical protein
MKWRIARAAGPMRQSEGANARTPAGARSEGDFCLRRLAGSGARGPERFAAGAQALGGLSSEVRHG